MTTGADKVRAFRASHSLTQPEAAELFGVSPRTWGNWETGLAQPPRTILMLIAYYNKYGPIDEAE